jgi:putative inorganic carbon (HCO3(-)) transporter
VIAFACAAIAWGALAFGAVYPWAYWPLFAALTITGVAGWTRRGSRKPPHRALVFAILAVAATVSLQLVPLPRRVIMAVSPSTDAFLRQYDLAYASGAVHAHALSIAPDATFLGLAAFVALSLFTLGMARALSGGGAGGIASAVASLGCLVALIAMAQKASGTAKIYGFWQPEDHAFQIFGPFVNKNHFAGWTIMALSLAIGAICGRLATAMRSVRRDWRSRALWFSTPDANVLILLVFASVLMGLALLLTRSRSGALCFGATLLLASWFIVRKRGLGSARRRTAVGFLACLVVVVASYAGLDPLLDRFSESGLTGRMTAWRGAFQIAHRFPVAGTGLNTFGTTMLFYEPSNGPHWSAAHNDYLQLMSEGGLLLGIPLVLLLCAFVLEVRSRFRSGKDDDSTYWLRVGAVTGIIAIGLQELVDFSLQLPGNAALFALLWAIAIHVRPVTLPRHVSSPDRTYATMSQRHRQSF